MQPDLSKRALEMPASSIRRIFNAALALEQQGHTVIKLHIGDPDLPTPTRITDAITAAMEAGHTRYSAMIGLLELRRAIAQRLIASHRITAEHFPTGEQYRIAVPGRDALEDSVCARVIVNQGATQALNSAMQACCDSGTALLLPAIYFPNYIQQTTLAGIRPLFYPLGDDFQPRLDQLEAALDAGGEAKPAALLVNSPGNPTGAVFDRATLDALYDFAERHNLWIIADEAYSEYVYRGEQASLLAIDLERPAQSRRVISIYSFGKSYAVTGMRMGYTVTPRLEVTERLALMKRTVHREPDHSAAARDDRGAECGRHGGAPGRAARALGVVGKFAAGRRRHPERQRRRNLSLCRYQRKQAYERPVCGYPASGRTRGGGAGQRLWTGAAAERRQNCVCTE